MNLYNIYHSTGLDNYMLSGTQYNRAKWLYALWSSVEINCFWLSTALVQFRVIQIRKLLTGENAKLETGPALLKMFGTTNFDRWLDLAAQRSLCCHTCLILSSYLLMRLESTGLQIIYINYHDYR